MKPPRTLSVSAAPHTRLCVHPGRLYLAQTVEVREVWAGRLDICKVVSA